MYIYAHAYIHVCVIARGHTRFAAGTSCIYINTYIGNYIFKYICMYAHVRMHVRVYMYI